MHVYLVFDTTYCWTITLRATPCAGEGRLVDIELGLSEPTRTNATGRIGDLKKSKNAVTT
jgi:hypothetical protein